jgi:hypothetical protein
MPGPLDADRRLRRGRGGSLSEGAQACPDCAIRDLTPAAAVARNAD